MFDADVKELGKLLSKHVSKPKLKSKGWLMPETDVEVNHSN